MSRARIFRQIVAIIPVCLMAMMNGIGYSWVSSNMPYLQSTEIEVGPFTNQQCILLALLLHFGRMCATVFNILILGQFGRKSPIIIAGSLFLISSGIIITSKIFLVVAISRFLNGLASGVFECFSPIYQGEIVLKNIRGTVSSCVSAFYSLGVLLQYMSSIWLNYDDAAIVIVTFSILMSLSTYCLIESPYFLSSSNPDKALKIIMNLRAIGLKQAEKELHEISSPQEETKVGHFFSCFKKPEIYKSFTITLSLGFLSTFTTAIFISCANSIIPDTKLLSSTNFAIFINIIPIVMSFISAICIDRTGRRPLLLIGFFLAIILNAIATILFYIKENSILKVANFSWIMFSIIVMFLVTYTVSISSPITALRTELFPISHKIIGVSSSIMFNSVAFSMATFFFMQVAKHYGMYLIFLVFCICSIFGLVFVHCLLPETKGKSLAEIQEILKNDKAIS